MPRDDDDLPAREDPEPDSDDNGQVETVPCPYCRREVYEEAERCPYCENYLAREDAPSQTPLWIVVTAVICLIAVALWVLQGW